MPLARDENLDAAAATKEAPHPVPASGHGTILAQAIEAQQTLESLFLDRLTRDAAMASPAGGDDDERTISVVAGVMAMEPTDPVEAILAAQLVSASDMTLELRRRAWEPSMAEALRLQQLALADKSARTVAALAQALDQHRDRRRPRTSPNVTVHDGGQAVVADQIIVGTALGGTKERY